jgi:oxygen-independent coproporphyrinogen III oxidase
VNDGDAVNESTKGPSRDVPAGVFAPPPGGPVRSVYVHAPFCVRRCKYCDFAVQVRRVGDVEGWSAAIAGEVTALREEGVFVLADQLDTVFVGGGTPSLLGPDAMERLANILGRERLRRSTLEWTAEANPESFSEEVARGWARAGVNRVSLGVQSFEETALRWMGRLHGSEGATQAVAIARSAGLHNLSVDLIFSLPDGVERSWARDLDRTLALEVPHVSLYGLTVEPETPLGRSVREGKERPADEARYRDEYLLAVERLTAAGYVQYEVSNFALPGHESRHNQVYWRGQPYVGLGNGAHSYIHPLRRWNLRDWDGYEGRARDGRLAMQDEERLDPAATRLERVWLGLRTTDGIPLEGLPSRALGLAREWVTSGWASASADTLRLTPQGWLLLDRLAVEMDELLEGAPGVRSPLELIRAG